MLHLHPFHIQWYKKKTHTIYNAIVCSGCLCLLSIVFREPHEYVIERMCFFFYFSNLSRSDVNSPSNTMYYDGKASIHKKMKTRQFIFFLFSLSLVWCSCCHWCHCVTIFFSLKNKKNSKIICFKLNVALSNEYDVTKDHMLHLKNYVGL